MSHSKLTHLRDLRLVIAWQQAHPGLLLLEESDARSEAEQGTSTSFPKNMADVVLLGVPTLAERNTCETSVNFVIGVTLKCAHASFLPEFNAH